MDSAYAFPDNEVRLPTKGYVREKLPQSIDLSHHLNLLSRSRKTNSLKDLYKYASQPGVIALAGGMPPASLFPFEEISAQIMPYNSVAKNPPTASPSNATSSSSVASQDTIKPQSWFSWLLGKKPTQTISVPKYVGSDPMDIQLSVLLQYSTAQGAPALQAFIQEFTEKIYKPGFKDWETLINIGATAGWNQVVNMLIERDDSILVEEWTYPGATGPYIPLNVTQVSLKMDGEGIIPSYMDELLSSWDDSKGVKKPKLLYTVPTGQNPTGATMLAKRKKEIYEIAVKHDVIICEDEPYYFLYADPWVSQKKSSGMRAMKEDKSAEDFLSKLPPSYLQFDYQGRVIRLDTFSKTIAPGSRLGWFTCNSMFAERLLRATEATTQAPCGIGQAMVAKLLTTWKYDGYVRWLRGIKASYAMRRDWMCDLFEEVFHLEFDQSLVGFHESIKWVNAYAKTQPGENVSILDEKQGFKSKKPLLSFVPPTAGMFVWLAVDYSMAPAFSSLKAEHGPTEAARLLSIELWKTMAEQKVLVSPGSFFDGQTGTPHEGFETYAFFRLSFSQASHEEMDFAIKKMYDIMVDFFKP